MLTGNARQRHGQRLAIGHVAGREGHRRPGLRQLGDQLLRTLATPTAHQQQMPYAVLGDQVPGHQLAQRPAGTGDQDRPFRLPVRRRRRLRGVRDQSGYEEPSLFQGDLWLTRGERRCDGRLGLRTDGHIDGHDASRVLGLRRTQQTPHRGRRRILRTRHPATRDHGEPGVLTVRRLGQEALDGLQHLGHARTDVPTGLDVLDHDLRRHPTGAVRHRHIRPPHLIQRVGGHRGAQLLPRHPLEAQLVHRHHRQTGAVERREPHGTIGTPRQPHPQRRRAHRVQPHPAPGERHPQIPVEQRVQCGIQQRRMYAELIGLARKLDLGEQLVARSPHRAQAPEHGPVPVSHAGQQLVRLGDIHGLGPGGRPHTLKALLRHGTGRGQHAHGVPDPLHPRIGAGVRVLDTGVHRDRPVPRVVRSPHRHLHRHQSLRRQHQRPLQRQLLHHRAADLVARVQRQLDERGAGQDDRAVDRVVLQPRVRVQGQLTGEDKALLGREGNGRAEQRVTGRAQTKTCRIHHRTPRGKPMTTPLEGVRRQLHQPTARHPRRPVHLHTGHEHLGHTLQQPRPLVLTTPQRADRRHTRRAHTLRGLGHRPQQDGMGAALDEDAVPGLQQLLKSGVETDRLTEVGEPVLRVHAGRVDDLAIHRREQRYMTTARLDTGQNVEEFVPQILHLRRVRGIVHSDTPRLNPIRLTPGEERLQLVRRTRHHDLLGTVDHRDLQTLGQPPGHLLLRRQYGDHAATPGQPQDRPAPQRHHPRRILQRQTTSHTRRRDLTLRMPHHRRRPHTKRPPQLRKRHHHREQNRLHHIDTAQYVLVPTPHHIQQRPAINVRLQRRRTFPHPRREHRGELQQLPRHPHPLRTLTREHQHHTTGRPGPRPALDHIRSQAADGQLRQSSLQFSTVPTEDDRSVLQHRTSPGQRESHIPRIQISTITDPRQQPRRLLRQRRLTARRQHPGHTALTYGLSLTGRHRLPDRRRLQDHVRVRPADTEGRHRRTARPLQLRPLLVRRQHTDVTGLPVDMARRHGDVQRARQNAVTHRLHHLDDTGHARRRLCVPDVGLHRPQPQRPVGVPPLAIRRQQRLRLDRVTQRRTRTVRLHHIHIRRPQPRTRQRITDHTLLRRTIRRRQTIAATVLVHRGTTHHRQDLVAVLLGVGEPLDHEHAHAFGPARAIGVIGERLAAAVGGEAALAGELDEHARRGQHRHTTGERHGALAVAQRLHRQMQCHQRRRARRVHRHRRALEPQLIRDTPRRDAGGVAGEAEALGAVDRGVQMRSVLHVHGADEHAGPAAAQRGRIDTTPLQGLPGGLQQQPLLRIHRRGLTRADPEELGVEVGGPGQEAAPAGVGGAGMVRVRVVEAGQVPAAVGGKLGRGVHLGDECLPQLLRRVDPTGQMAGHADDGDRIVVGGGRHGGGGPGVVHGAQDAEDLVVQMRGEGARRRVVEEDARGHPQAGRRDEAVAQLHGEDRVQAQVAEGRVGVGGGGAGGLRHVVGQPADQESVRLGADALAQGEGGGADVLLGLGGGRAFVEPVAPALEGVGGQADGSGLADRPGPVDGDTGAPGFGEAGEQRLRLGAVAVLQRHREVRVGRGDERGQRAARAEFEEPGHALLAAGGDRVVEAHRGAEVPDPVVLRQGGPGPPGDGGDDGDAGFGDGEAPDPAGELVQHGGGQRRVGGVLHPQSARAVAAGAELVRDPGDRLVGAGEHDGPWPVDDADRDVVDAVEGRERFLFRRLDRDHGAAGRQFLHQLPARGDEGGGMGQGQGPGHMGGDDLAEGVADEQVGGDAPRGDQAVEGDLEGEQGGLHVAHAVEGVGGGIVVEAAEQHLAQVETGHEVVEHLVEGVGEDRVRLVQFPPHADALGATAGEEEGRPARRGDAVHRVVVEAGQARCEPVPVRADDDRAVFERGPADGQRPGDVGDVGVRLLLEMGEQTGGLRVQGAAGAGGQHPGHGPCGLRAVHRGVGAAGVRRFGEDDVAVGAADAERADARYERGIGGGPCVEFGLHPEVQLGQGYRRVGGAEVQAGRQLTVAQGQRGLEQAHDPCGGLEVADVRLHRAHPQRPAVPAAPADDIGHGGGLDGVSDRGAGAVEFDVLDGLGADPGVGVGPVQDVPLARDIGVGEAVAAAVVVDGAALDDAVDGVAVGDGPGERLEQDHSAALTAYEPVGALVEGGAAPLGGQRAKTGRGPHAVRREDQVHPAGEGEVGVPAAEALAGQVDGDQGRRLRRVDGEAGAL